MKSESVIQKGKSPFREAHLHAILKKAVKKELLDSTTDISRAMNTSASFLTVGTLNQTDGSIDLTYDDGDSPLRKCTQK